MSCPSPCGPTQALPCHVHSEPTDYSVSASFTILQEIKDKRWKQSGRDSCTVLHTEFTSYHKENFRSMWWNQIPEEVRGTWFLVDSVALSTNFAWQAVLMSQETHTRIKYLVMHICYILNPNTDVHVIHHIRIKGLHTWHLY